MSIVKGDAIQGLFDKNCSVTTIQEMIDNEDWCYWRRIEERIMEDEDLKIKWLMAFPNQFEYMKADLPTRCKALISVLQNNDNS